MTLFPHLPPPRRARVAVALLATTLLAPLTGAEAAQGQPPPLRLVTLTGVVRDSATGEVLPNARVGVQSSPRVVITNADGRFTLLGVPAAPQQLRVQYIGYRTVTLPVQIYNSIRSIITPDLAAVSVVFIVIAGLAIALLDRVVGLEIFLKSK